MSIFSDKMESLCRKLSDRMDKVSGNEQATKESLIKPFFAALGYDTEDPDSWTPEYNADFQGKKKSEKVDYAIMKNNSPILFIEAKAYFPSEKALPSKDGQIARYFNSTPTVKLSVITNGVVYRFFSDLSRDNIQDEEPFWVFDIRKFNSTDLETLEMFSFNRLDIPAIKAWASDQVGCQKVKTFVTGILLRPENAPDFIRFILDHTYDGVKSKSVVEVWGAKIPGIVKDSINECIKMRLGLDKSQESLGTETQKAENVNAISTTVDELKAFSTIRGILAGSGRDSAMVKFKDYANWTNVSYRRLGNWFIRLYFNETPKVILFRLPTEEVIAIQGKSENINQRQAGTEMQLSDLEDIDSLAKLICAAFDRCVSDKVSEAEVDDDDTSKSA